MKHICLELASTCKKSLVVSLCIWIAAQSMSAAATIPAGTRVTVTTVDALSTHERPGRPFKAQLAADIKVRGKTVLPTGTPFLGVVETSRNPMVRTTTKPLTVNLRSVSVNGREVPVKTTGAVAPETLSAFTAQQKRTGVSAGKGVLDRGTQLQFRLAQPLNI